MFRAFEIENDAFSGLIFHQITQRIDFIDIHFVPNTYYLVDAGEFVGKIQRTHPGNAAALADKGDIPGFQLFRRHDPKRKTKSHAGIDNALTIRADKPDTLS